MDMEHSLTADEAIMEMERFRTFTINNEVVAQSAGAGYFVWLLQQLRSGQHSLDSDDDDGRQDEANQFDLESGYPTEDTVQAGQQVHPMMIFNLLAPHLGVDFEASADRVFEEGAHDDDDDGARLVGAFVVPASDAVVAGLKKQAFHATTERCGVTGCAICLEDFEDGEEVAVMPCSRGHEFHPGCITEWLGKSNTCPLCRHALPTDVDDGP